jgi:hypothetical protein
MILVRELGKQTIQAGIPDWKWARRLIDRSVSEATSLCAFSGLNEVTVPAGVSSQLCTKSSATLA